jgi:hypothetical protein
MLEDKMSNILGVDLGGTSLDYVLADNNGEFLHEKSFPSPFRKMSNSLPDGEPEVYIDTKLDNISNEEKIFNYLAETEAEFLKEAEDKIGGLDLESKGYSLCGKTWEHGGKIFMIGGNTPTRFATRLENDEIGICVLESGSDRYNIKAANDGNAAATAQGIYYSAIENIDPIKTGYFILGTGFGFGIPEYFALTEIGHIPVGFVPKALWQKCGCTDSHKTACAENYVSGRGIQSCAEILLSLRGQTVLNELSEHTNVFDQLNNINLFNSVETSRLRNYNSINSSIVMGLARNNSDELAVYIETLAAAVTAFAAVTAAQLFGLRIISIGESVACLNPWHVDKISKIVNSYANDSKILKPSLRVELTPLKNPAKYGALSLVIPKERYVIWAERMERRDSA